MIRLVITYSNVLFPTLKLFILLVVVQLSPESCSARTHALADQFAIDAKALSSQGLYLEAARMYEKSAAAERESSEPRPSVLVSQSILAGWNYLQSGQNISRAIEHFQHALENNKGLGREDVSAIALNNIGHAYFKQQEFDKAIDRYQQALAINRELSKDDKVAEGLIDISLAHLELNRYDKVIKYARQAREAFDKLGRDEGVARTLNLIGNACVRQGKYTKAVNHFNQFLEINRRQELEEGVADGLTNIGYVYSSWGRYDRAIDYYQQSLEINRKLGRDNKTAQGINNIGYIYSSWGRYDEAIEYYQQALAIDRKLDGSAEIARDINNIGHAYSLQGRYDKAIKYYHEALAINRRLGRDAESAIALNNIGYVYSSRDHYDKAIEYFQQSLEINRKLGRDADIAAVLNNMGQLNASLGRYVKALVLYKRALRIVRKLGRDADKAQTLNNIGNLYFYWERYETAINYYRQAVLLIEKIRKTAQGDLRRDYLAAQIYIYRSLASASLNKGDPGGVLDAVEQTRARLLAERMADIGSPMKIPDLNEVQKSLAQDEAVLLFSNIDSDDFILMVISSTEIVMKELSKDDFLVKSNKLYNKKVLHPILLLMEKQRGLTAGNKKRKQDVQSNRQGEAFETAIHYYRALLMPSNSKGEAGRVEEEALRFGRLLHTLLIEPAMEQLSGKTKIIVMPDGILGFLPFETLVDENNRYLVQSFNLSYTQSLTIDKLLQGRDYRSRDRNKPMLSMGGAVYEPVTTTTPAINNARQLDLLKEEASRLIGKKQSARSAYGQLGYINWPNLPGTFQEVTEISSIIKGGDTLTGDKVTENRIKRYSREGKLADYKIIHFATHGLVVPEIPELSAIVLSQFEEEKDGEDGYLSMNEIAQLDLAADFVNLSACETGLGKIYAGEGIVGLTQSFLIAGANGVSVSLWQVADLSTARFMMEFYKKVENSDVSYKQAITDVKNGFIRGDFGEKWKAPYFWSPFVYYGVR